MTFSYDDRGHILKGIDLDIDSGKTRLCNRIPRFYEVKEGEITIGGIPIRDVTLASLRGSIGDNILYGKVAATEEEVVEAAKRANIHEFVTSPPDGYNAYIGEKEI